MKRIGWTLRIAPPLVCPPCCISLYRIVRSTAYDGLFCLAGGYPRQCPVCRRIWYRWRVGDVAMTRDEDSVLIWHDRMDWIVRKRRDGCATAPVQSDTWTVGVPPGMTEKDVDLLFTSHSGRCRLTVENPGLVDRPTAIKVPWNTSRWRSSARTLSRTSSALTISVPMVQSQSLHG